MHMTVIYTTVLLWINMKLNNKSINHSINLLLLADSQAHVIKQSLVYLCLSVSGVDLQSKIEYHTITGVPVL